MIRHIVQWKLRAEDAEAKAAAVTEIAAALEGLVPVIDELISLEVHPNVAYADVNWDVVLVADYASVEDLAAYQVHPAHVAAAAIVRSHVTERASIDFEI
ncbi:MAG: Dabb family protein [Rhodoglobus sp.]